MKAYWLQCVTMLQKGISTSLVYYIQKAQIFRKSRTEYTQLKGEDILETV